MEGDQGQTIYNAGSSADGSQSTHAWRGRQVIPAGRTCKLVTTGAWDVTLSGYQLSAP